jgi:hypothetical protein
MRTLRRFGRLGWLLLLILLVVASVFASRALADWRYIVPDAPGTLLYATGFDAPDVNVDWEQAQGRLSAQITDGVMRLDVGAASEGVFAPLRWHFNDFDIRVQTTATDGPENNSYGVLFRQRDLNNYYYFLISSDSHYTVYRVTDGVVKQLSQWIESDIIEYGIGATNQIRVTGHGNQFQFFVNDQIMALCIPDDPEAESTYNYMTGECIEGQMLTTMTDDAHTYGRVGLVVQTLDEPDVVVDFDQVVIFSPTALPPEQDAASAINHNSYAMNLP